MSLQFTIQENKENVCFVKVWMVPVCNTKVFSVSHVSLSDINFMFVYGCF